MRCSHKVITAHSLCPTASRNVTNQMAYSEDTLQRITAGETLKIYVYCLIWGVWALIKHISRIVWRRSFSKAIPAGHIPVGKPPECLVDSSFGQHSYVKLKGVKLHYVEAGNRNRPVVLLLHGFPDCWLTWRYQIPELAKYFRVIAVDLKGFGDSDKPESRSSYRIDKIVDELAELIHCIGCDRCIVIGHDVGALMGWFMAHFKPHLVDKLVVISAPHPNLYWSSVPNAGFFNPKWIQFCQLPYLPEFQALDNNLNIIESCYQHLKTNGVNKNFMEAYKYVFSRTEDWTGPINYYRNLPFWRIKCGEQGSMVPTLLIAGNKDNCVHMESVIKSTEYVEKSTLKVVEGASHYPHQERPTEVNRLLTNFFSVTPLKKSKPVVPVTQSDGGGIVNRVIGVATNNNLWKQYSGYFAPGS